MKQKYLLQTITPVHIGSGEVLNHIDGCYDNGRWYNIDLDKVLTHPSTDINALTSEMSRREFRWQTYLSRHNLDPVELSNYSLICTQSPETTDIREAIKSVGYRPYIPGSTIKGALRTALLAGFIDKDDNLFEKSLDYLKNITKQRGRGNPRRETPAQKIEKDAFGKDPNHDLLRALQVSDTTTFDSESLEISTAWTITLNRNNQLVQKIENGREYKNFVQQLSTGQQTTLTLKIDDLLFRENEKLRLRFSESQEEWLRDFAEVCRSEANVYMQDERDFFVKYDFPNMPNIYDKLIEINSELTEGAFLLQIGWGTGYEANTITSSFVYSHEASEDLMIDLRKRFELGKSRSQRDYYDEREFPKTRRIIYRGENPIAPLGWVKISPVEDS